MVSAFASSWPSPPLLETPRKKEESLKALKALVRDWDLLGREEEEEEGEKREGEEQVGEEGRQDGMQGGLKQEDYANVNRVSWREK